MSVFLSGDDADAKQTVGRLAEQLGFSPIDVGPLTSARMLEGLADFIRHMMGAQRLGVFATISVQVLPPPERQRLGGRQPSHLPCARTPGHGERGP